MKTLILAAALTLCACADQPERTARAPTPPTAADTSATSPMTVNPTPAGKAAPAPTPPATPDEDHAMPPGPVNPGG